MGNTKKANDIVVTGDIAIIDVSTKKMPHRHATIDRGDLPLVLAREMGRWCAYPGNSGDVVYVASTRSTDSKAIKMHRLICGVTDPLIKIDHKDGNGLNNRRNNLRIATTSQNGANRRKETKKKTSSLYKGVNYNTRRCWWVATIYKEKKAIYLGHFPTQHEAAIAYNRAAKEIFGEFAKLNVIVEATKDQTQEEEI